MKQYIFSFLLVFIILPKVSGQDYAELGKKQVTLKFAPLAMFDIDNTYAFAVEVPLSNPKFSLQQELGYGHAATNLWYSLDNYKPRKYTIRLKAQFRYYYFERSIVRGYLGVEYFYKRTQSKEKRWVGQDCQSFGACSFSMEDNVSFVKQVHAIHPKVGWQFYFGPRFSLDLYTGFGARVIDNKVISENKTINLSPHSGDINWFDSWQKGTHVYPSLSAGIQLGVRLGKIKME